MAYGQNQHYEIWPQMFFRRASILKIEKTQFSPLRLAIVLFIAFFRTALAGNFYAGTSPANVPWPSGIVPYEFTNTLTAAQTNTYLAGLREWELAGNVKFVPHTSQTHWILFTYNTNGFDNVSSATNPQVVSVSSMSRAQVGHEMGHSFGFNHENIRPDAASYIAVLTNNIADEPGNIHWFAPDPTTVTNGAYDYESVMHLGWDFDSTNPGVLATQQPRPPNFPRYQFRQGNYCLSPGDRAALAYLYGPPAVPPTNIVTTTADVGPGSLRAAIYYVTDHPGTMVKFNVPVSDSGYSNGVFNIHLTGHLPPLVENSMVIDGSTQPGFNGKPLIIVDGSQIIPETFTSDTMLIYSSDNQVKNISFTGFDWNGLTLVYADATNNTISGCWFGLDATGTNTAPNAYQGILIANGARWNTIGGTNALARNVLSGNAQYGVLITDSNTAGNVVLGNYLGTDASGTNAVPNGKSGVLIGNGANGNFIGSTNPAGRNLLSGNLEFGVFITDPNTTGNVVLGNFIGPDASGNQAVANGLGGLKIVSAAHNNLVGGASSSARNIISGNTDTGIRIEGSGNNTVQGNFAGLNAAGDAALPNGFTGMYLYGGAQSNLVLNNVFSGNPSEGLRLYDTGTSANFVQGNYFGTDASGSGTIPNGYAGVTMFAGATANIIGGITATARNLISGNYYDVVIGDPGTSGNLVQGNLIGTDLSGTNALGYSFLDVVLQNSATGNFIGGIGAGAGNVIAFAGGSGVVLYDPGTTNNSIRGNSILSNFALGIDLVGASDVYPYVTPNDIGDGDVGPNNLQNFPVITNAFGNGTSTIVLGKMNSLPGGNFLIDVYRNIAASSSGYGQGQFYLGTVNVTTDGSGNASFAYTNGSGNYTGQFITTTATAANGDTSEFSAAMPATNTTVASAQFGKSFAWQTSGFVFNLTLQTNFTYRIQATTNLAGNPIPWIDLTNFNAVNSSLTFTDHTAASFRTRFYRVISP
jgi:parallel beta-helix repeat protein